MIYLDIETLDFFQDERIKALPRDQQLKAMRLGVAVTCGQWSDFVEWFPSDLDGLWYEIGEADVIVGWNIIDFDLPVLNYNWDDEADLSRLNCYDIFAEIRKATGRWYKLEDVAQANLGRGKLADGQKAAEWLRSGEAELIAKAVEYCRYDVRLTVDLYEILLSDQPLRLPPRLARQELNEILFWRDGRIERVPDALGALSTR